MQNDGGSVLFRGIRNLVAGQVSVRVITFGLNLITARILTPEAYGLASVQFHLLNTGIVFLSREGFRRGCQRAAQAGGVVSTRKTLALGSLCIPLGACITFTVCSISVWGLRHGKQHAEVQAAAVVMQGIAAFMELCCGPLYILAKVQHQDNVVSFSEAAATVAKGGLTLILLKQSSLAVAVALSWAQIAYAATAMAVYLSFYAPVYLRHKGSQPKPGANAQATCSSSGAAEGISGQSLKHRHSPSAQSADARMQKGQWKKPEQLQAASQQTECTERLIDARSLAMCWRFLLQAVVHLLQTEGSKMVLALCESSYNQGVYGLVTNLGSLVVRTIFFPVEEAAFRAFSSPSGNDVKQSQQKLQMLAVLVRVFGLIGLLALAFGPSYSYVLLRLVYGQRWSNTEAPTALSYYCGYITLLALNGCTEAYVNATADSRQLSRSIQWQTAFSTAQIALSFAFVWTLGAVGLILADSANMAMRIAYSCLFIQKQIQQVPHSSTQQAPDRSAQQVPDRSAQSIPRSMPSIPRSMQSIPRWLPSWQSCAACIAAACAVRISNSAFMSQHAGLNGSPAIKHQSGLVQDAVWHMFVGVACLVCVMVAMAIGEADLKHQVKELASNSKQHAA